MASPSTNNLLIIAVVVLAAIVGFMFYQSRQSDVSIVLPDIEIHQE